MKQAEESKRQAHDSARRILEEYGPLKHDVDLMRTELLGLEKLPDLPNEDKEKMGSIGLLDKPKMPNPFDPHHGPLGHPWGPHESAQQQAAAEKAAAGFFGLSGSRAAQGTSHGNPFLAAAAAQHSAAAMGLGPLGPLGAKAEQLRTSLTAQSVGSVSGPPPFR